MTEPTKAAEITRLVLTVMDHDTRDDHFCFGDHDFTAGELERRIQNALDTGGFPTLQEKR